MTTVLTPPRAPVATTLAATAHNATKVYGHGEAQVRALDGVTVEFGSRPLHRHHGPVGLGQVDAHALPRRARHAHVGLGVRSATPTSAKLNDRQLTQLRRDRIGFIFQAFNLVPTLTALENITLPSALAGRKPDKAWLDHVIDTVGLRNRLEAPPVGALRWSAAARRRRPGARVASRRSSSPTSPPATSTPARAPRSSSFMRTAVRELGQTIVMVTHDPVAASYADRAVFLADGRIVDEIDAPDRRCRPRPHQEPGGLSPCFASPSRSSPPRSCGSSARPWPCSSASPSSPARSS